ncbi:hypothetical protein [Paenibacillus sp. BK720]|uniref:hypothetical protein n=1 Tax=Paenibacillus sp. BK720 TaxID=2587092 RepID=UPI001421EBCA|nr:hypothetical protein [Paenibacillus sp. BK720]NIK66967.1 hypothetical protein [Paenibacillus sp. BK720]
MSKLGELAVITIVVVSVVLCIQYTKRTYYGDDGVIITAKSKPMLNEVPVEVKAIIAVVHGILDDLLGWGADEEFQFTVSDKKQLKAAMDKMDGIPPLSSDILSADLQNAQDLLKVGVIREDLKAIQYAYRILNDLDITFNDYFGDKVWNYSLAGAGNGKNVEKVRKYLNLTDKG